MVCFKMTWLTTSIHYEDERLDRLWQHAVDVGHYTKEELHSLHNEMQHMEKKFLEVRALSQKNREILRNLKDNESDIASENMVELSADTGLEAEELHEQLMEKESTINKQFVNMQETVLNKKKSDFNDDRVSRLWDSAQTALFTADELQTVKEELSHFQRHIDKLNHWEYMNSKLEGESHTEEALHAQDKINDLKRKVKKYHKTIGKKIKEKIEL